VKKHSLGKNIHRRENIFNLNVTYVIYYVGQLWHPNVGHRAASCLYSHYGVACVIKNSKIVLYFHIKTDQMKIKVLIIQMSCLKSPLSEMCLITSSVTDSKISAAV
jgi:hypothetical protein